MPTLNTSENYQRAIRLASMKKRNNQNQLEEAAASSAALPAPQEEMPSLGPTQPEIPAPPPARKRGRPSTRPPPPPSGRRRGRPFGSLGKAKREAPREIVTLLSPTRAEISTAPREALQEEATLLGPTRTEISTAPPVKRRGRPFGSLGMAKREALSPTRSEISSASEEDLTLLSPTRGEISTAPREAPQEEFMLLGPTRAEISSAPPERSGRGRPKGSVNQNRPAKLRVVRPKQGRAGRPKKSEMPPRAFGDPVKDLEIPLISFKRGIQKVQNTIPGAESFRYTKEAAAALQYGVEAFLSELFEDAHVYISSMKRPRKTFAASDLQYVYEARKRRFGSKNRATVIRVPEHNA